MEQKLTHKRDILGIIFVRGADPQRDSTFCMSESDYLGESVIMTIDSNIPTQDIITSHLSSSF